MTSTQARDRHFLEWWSSAEAHHENMATNIVASGRLGRILPLLTGPPDNGMISRMA